MAKNCLTLSLDIEYPAVGKLIDDLRHHEGIIAIHLADDRRALSTERDQKKFTNTKPTQTFSAALLQTLYTDGPKTKDALREILPQYNKAHAHFSQTLSYLRSTGRTVYFAKNGMWNLSKSYRVHVDKRLNGDVIIPTRSNDVVALPKPVSNGHGKKSKMSGGDLIMKLLTAKQAPMNRADLKIAFVKDGRSKTSVGDQLFKLVKAHKVKRVDKGTYELIA